MELGERHYTIFCYTSLKMPLQNLLLCAGFVDACEQWHSERVFVFIKTYMMGKFGDFQHIDGEPLLH